jgi:hypothetical protein
VGGLVEKTPSVGVAEAGNQTMVEVGSGVSVKTIGAGVAFIESKKVHELPIPAMRIGIRKCKKNMCV